MDTTFRNLTPVEDSLFLTLYLRALDARSSVPLLGDARSADLAGQLGYDFSRQKALRNQVLDLALRTKRLDDLVRGFVARNRDAVVLDLGCGLDPRVIRCRPPDGVVEELLLVRDPDVARYPQPLRSFTRLCARSTRISRHGNRVLRYAF
jgi:O-methyltransferase involved in polyketide biosynthesis